MIHVLQIVPELNPSGGIENVLMNYYRAIDRTRFQFDFVTHSIVDDAYAKEAESLGAHVCLMPKFTPQAFPRIEAKFAAVMRSQRYDVVHCNMANAAFLYLQMAKKAGIDKRILHGHMIQYADVWTHSVRNVPLVAWGKRYTNIRLACSKAAGDFLFGSKPYTILPNAIDLDKYKFSEAMRRAKRAELGLTDDQFAICDVGRLTPVKNQQFLVSLMPQILRRVPNAVLFIVGTGYLLAQLQQQADSIGVAGHIRFLGIRTDLNELYSAMDCFVLPSICEGLSESLVEAQIAGLPCFVSIGVPRESQISDSCQFLDCANQTDWLNKIDQAAQDYAKKDVVAMNRLAGFEAAQGTTYNINQTVNILENIYAR
ncbi:MAG: glycosyltransferase [Bifidobacteriaceae bacterium]|nr:glycosyltransferase [Bifidobacteriaceae bacterium]